MQPLLMFVALVALTLAVRELATPAPNAMPATMLLGFVLLASYLAGKVAAAVRLPRITGYVLAGILVGPFALGILDAPTVASFRIIDDLALALIALTAGGELRVAELRRSFRAIVGIGLGVLLIVMVGMALLVVAVRPFIPPLADQPWSFTAAAALILGIWSGNSSPDATIAVINEAEVHGDLTETILGVTILKDVLVIILLATALALAGPLVDPQATFDSALLGQVAWEVGGAILIGAVAGWGFALYLEHIAKRSVLATLMFTYLLTLAADGFHVELLLLAVSAGFVIENGSPAGDQLIHAIEANALVVFAVFFALAGAALDLRVFATFWFAALVIVLIRGGLTWLGAWIGAAAAAAPRMIQRLAWRGLISQAGVTLGLALLVGREFPEWGNDFVALATAIIIVHLLTGPILLKSALVRSGELVVARSGEEAPPATRRAD
ncbi:MAG TPA: cation:proton antiporter [Longimicrobiales bacterium]